MDKKSKILVGVFVLLITASIAATYWRVFLKKDYMISAQVDCDPATEACFIWECDPETPGECTGDPEEDIWYYEIIKKKAANIPDCDPEDENCEALVCQEGETDCEYILCSSETASEGEKCSNPEEYLAENPEESEESEGEEEGVSEDEEKSAEEEAELPAEREGEGGTGEF